MSVNKRQLSPDAEKKPSKAYHNKQSKTSNHKHAKSTNHEGKGQSDNNNFPKYGNYAHYYGYRNTGLFTPDPRIRCFKREWFEKRRVLDIGCNKGTVTLQIARNFNPVRCVGTDIDQELIRGASQNLLNLHSVLHNDTRYFPVSCSFTFGPIPIIRGKRTREGLCRFPENTSFECIDVMAKGINDEYDTILGLSITKWIHLNWGDIGIRKFFQNVFDALSSTGVFILEAQDFDTYEKKLKHEEHKKNVTLIELKPSDFEKYLLEKVGFARAEELHDPLHVGDDEDKGKGFARRMIAFHKQ